MVTRSDDDSFDDDSPWYSAQEGGWPGLPERPRQFVSRGRLLDQLDATPDSPLVLVSAPAGTGKTSLVADWASTRSPGRLEWITFDHGEVLWPAFLDALERLGIAIPTTSSLPGDAGLDPHLRRQLAVAIASESEPLTVVIDGYDVSSATVAADVDFLLKHNGHRMRLVLLTRADPVLPLYRYRLDESMTEVRMADLALRDEEASALLAQMGVSLSAESVHELNTRTRGWVTGMRFAGKLLLDHADPDGDIGQVKGERGSIAEYLMGEVLATQRPEDLELLMALSVPDTIEPGLACALAGESAARALTSLSRVNVFLESVPEQVERYRFHPFLRDLLRAELAYRSPAMWADLHRRTARWYAVQGLLVPAARHHAAVEEWDEVARLVVDHDAWAELLLGEGTPPLVQVLQSLPGEVDDPAAVVVRAALALAARDRARFDQEMESFDLVDDHPSHEALVRAHALLSALRARDGATPAEAMRHSAAAEHAAMSRPGPASGLVPLALLTKGIAQARLGLTAEARATLGAGVVAAERSHAPALVVECLGLLALLACAEGDLTQGASTAAQAIRAASAAGIAVRSRPAAPEIALAWVATDQFDLRAAGDHLQAAELAQVVSEDPVSHAFHALVTSRLRAAHGDRGAAVTTASSAVDDLGDEDRWLSARLRLELALRLIARGDVDEARVAIEAVDEPSAAPAVALVLGQVDLALGDDDGAARALAQARGPGAPVPVRVSASLAECARLLRAGAGPQAHQVLLDALLLARRDHLRRPFHEAAPPVRQALQQDRRLATAHAWLFDRSGRAMARPARPATPQTTPPVRTPAPVEQLTEKEMEVLGHLAALLTTEEIAAEMYISVNTVRTHVRNILRKLGVSRRNAAVRVAREHELLPG